jgi:glycosyltransferase involved in cell wall biosynthesis
MERRTKSAVHAVENGFLPHAFVTYLNRVIASAGDWGEVVITDDRAVLSDSTLVGVVAGKPRKWTRKDGQRTSGLVRQFSGAYSDEGADSGTLPVEIFDRWDRRQIAIPPPSFDVLAIITAYNEADIIRPVIDHLVSQGIRVHVIDNWSTDGTTDVVADLVEKGFVELERYPAEVPKHFNLEQLLTRVEEVAGGSGADWVIHNDADEVHESPWLDVSLINAFWMVEQWGYNCVDHTIVDFRPVEDVWRDGGDLGISFPWCEFGDESGHFTQLRAWKPQRSRVQLASSGGHQAIFEGRRAFPYKFVTRHYSIRSQAHGERKIFQERQPRWNPAERAYGWHVQYDRYDADTSFIWAKEGLFRWDQVDQRFLLERLSGVGLRGNPWPNEGPIER